MDKAALLESIEKNVRYSFARSGGKGGQNVNKVNTKVHASVSLSALEGLSESEAELLRGRLANIINSDGEIFLDASDERFQERNRVIALGRLKSRIVQAALVAKKRKKTKPTKASIEKRLRGKKLRSLIKQNRRGI